MLQSFKEDRMNSHKNARLTALAKARARPATEIVCYFAACGPYASHQHGNTRRICFVTPTKLPYPWKLLS